MKDIVQCVKIYYGLSIREIKELAWNYAKKIEINYQVNWNANKQAGKDWFYAFMKRHSNLSMRLPEQISLNRAKGFNYQNVREFFSNYNDVLSVANFDAFSIYNMDETGFSTVPTKIGKIVAEKGVKRVGILSAQERGSMITMALAVNAAGVTVPPLLYSRQNECNHRSWITQHLERKPSLMDPAG